MLDQLHAATFSAHLHTLFKILPPAMPLVEAELIEVAERGATEATPPWAAARQERFSIVFRGPHERLLQQGIYQIQHDRLGAFELFLVPVGQDQHGIYYEAVFNRIRQHDG